MRRGSGASSSQATLTHRIDARSVYLVTTALGAVAFGVALDLAGGAASPIAWVIAFGSLALIALLGPVALVALAGKAIR